VKNSTGKAVSRSSRVVVTSTKQATILVSTALAATMKKMIDSDYREAASKLVHNVHTMIHDYNAQQSSSPKQKSPNEFLHSIYAYIKSTEAKFSRNLVFHRLSCTASRTRAQQALKNDYDYTSDNNTGYAEKDDGNSLARFLTTHDRIISTTANPTIVTSRGNDMSCNSISDSYQDKLNDETDEESSSTIYHHNDLFGDDDDNQSFDDYNRVTVVAHGVQQQDGIEEDEDNTMHNDYTDTDGSDDYTDDDFTTDSYDSQTDGGATTDYGTDSCYETDCATENENNDASSVVDDDDVSIFRIRTRLDQRDQAVVKSIEDQLEQLKGTHEEEERSWWYRVSGTFNPYDDEH